MCGWRTINYIRINFFRSPFLPLAQVYPCTYMWSEHVTTITSCWFLYLANQKIYSEPDAATCGIHICKKSQSSICHKNHQLIVHRACACMVHNEWMYANIIGFKLCWPAPTLVPNVCVNVCQNFVFSMGNPHA